jgi:hypothetical protein
MSIFLDNVRRKSGFPGDSSDDDLSFATDEGKQRRTSGSAAASRVQRTTLPRSIKSRTVDPTSPVAQESSLNITPASSKDGTSSLPAKQLTVEDLEICQRLDEEYERALEEREIGYNARYHSVRQSAVLSVFFMVAFLGLGTTFFMRQAAWTIPESMLFSIYTITTVGYGRTEMPTTPGFQAYSIFYILVGIAALTIMVGSMISCFVLPRNTSESASCLAN